MPSVLVIDDDRAVRHMIEQAFQDKDITVLAAGTAQEGYQAVEEHHPDVVLLDIILPEQSGLEVFGQLRQMDAKLPVIFITAGGTSDTAIEAMKLGAHDYLLKPLDLAQVRMLTEQALEIRRQMHVPVNVAQPESADTPGDVLIGRSPEMQEVLKSIGRVAHQPVTVLIRGESGTGKELVARAIYQHSDRADGPFLAVNCAAIPEALLESELFGHEKGAFTGADRQRIGKFEQCSGGTIFLDEIGDMSLLVQSKVLRLLQDQRFERVGGNRMVETDVRIISATHQNLEEMVAKGEFRTDLYYRLNSFTIELPPLRDRGSDILLLLQHYLARLSRELGKDVHSIAPAALQTLMEYSWPGNVRELQSVLKQCLLYATGPVIVPEFLPESLSHERRSTEPGSGKLRPEPDETNGDFEAFLEERLASGSNALHGESIEWLERHLIVRVLRVTGGNQSKAADLLGITRGSLRNKIRSLGITIGQVVDVPEEVGTEDPARV